MRTGGSPRPGRGIMILSSVGQTSSPSKTTTTKSDPGGRDVTWSTTRVETQMSSSRWSCSTRPSSPTLDTENGQCQVISIILWKILAGRFRAELRPGVAHALGLRYCSVSTEPNFLRRNHRRVHAVPAKAFSTSHR